MVRKENYASYGNYRFDYEWDKGGDPEYPIIIWIFDLIQEEFVGKRYFEANTSKQHIHNFMKKIAHDVEYRREWNVKETKEQQLESEIKELERKNNNLFEYLHIYEHVIKNNDELKKLFIDEISKNDYKNGFMVAPLQIKKKKNIVKYLNTKD